MFDSLLIAEIDWPLVGAGAVGLVCVGAALVAYWNSGGARLRRKLRRIFGREYAELPVVQRSFPHFQIPNLHLAVMAYCDASQGRVEHVGFLGGTLLNLKATNSALGNLRYSDLDIDVDQQMRLPENELHLIDGEQKLAIYLRWQQYGNALEVMARDADTATQCIRDIQRLLPRVNVYRGKILSLEFEGEDQDYPGFAQVRFHQLAKIQREDIILPESLLNLIERNTIRFFNHVDVLRRSGRSVKRGILLYGPPGVGKTITAQWLAHSLPKVTVLLLSGNQLWRLKEACQMARALAPSLVIMEDVDLIAEKREHMAVSTALHQLLNEMDGLAPESDVVFLLTTNRPEVLEPALVNRPGRIDQAIHFPLPDADCRRRLFDLYGQGLEMEIAQISRFITKTDGASPAFIQELVRKAAMIAAESQSHNGQKLRVTDEHLDEALGELLLQDSGLTRRFLGFHATES